MALEISLAIIAIAFVILAIYLIITLIEVKNTLTDIRRVLIKAEQHVNPLGEETQKILQTYNSLGQEFINKSDDLTPLFKTIMDVGQRFQDRKTDASQSARRPIYVKVDVEEEQPKPSTKVDDLVELGILGLNLFQKFSKRGR